MPFFLPDDFKVFHTCIPTQFQNPVMNVKLKITIFCNWS